jgi:hypothetical protein
MAVKGGMTKADFEAAPNFRAEGDADRGQQAPRTGTRGGSVPRQ